MAESGFSVELLHR